VRRRQFIGLLGGAMAAWPLTGRAQQRERMRRIGVLTGYVENDREAQRRVGAFRDKLQALGWTKGRNVEIDYRWAAADPERMRTYAAELVALGSHVILASGERAVLAVRRTTPDLPVVFVQVDDPLGSGFIKSLTHPEGNLTGFTPFEFSMGGKMLEILKEIAPRVSRVAIILNPDSIMHVGTRRVVEAAAPSVGVQLTIADVRSAAEIERALDAFARQPNDGGLIVPSFTLANINRHLIIALAARHRLPTIYPFRHFVGDGGLISYGIDPADQFRDAASYVDRILKGERPAELPVQGPTKFELAINLKTAKALGLDVPPMLLARADEVIE
jgi:putative tryptophan/tyrosine transport system substrate-binding protein